MDANWVYTNAIRWPESLLHFNTIIFQTFGLETRHSQWISVAQRCPLGSCHKRRCSSGIGRSRSEGNRGSLGPEGFSLKWAIFIHRTSRTHVMMFTWWNSKKQLGKTYYFCIVLPLRAKNLEIFGDWIPQSPRTWRRGAQLCSTLFGQRCSIFFPGDWRSKAKDRVDWGSKAKDSQLVCFVACVLYV